MAINFCSARLKTKISSSAVSCEGYDVTNLLSCVPLLQCKGFLAEGFTKPPVSIYLKFLCNVDINHIVLWVEVGCQKSNGLELVAAADSEIYEKSERDKPAHNSCPSLNTRIGSCKFSHESGVVFQKYKGWCSPKVPSNFLVKHFNTSVANVVRNCSDLEIKIFSTANSSVPSMKKIEVWGRPGRYCPENVKLNIHTLWNQPVNNIKKVPVNEHLQLDGRNNSNAPSTSSGLCGPVVPEEFLDPITLNIMAIPMTLPCGKAVDLSTLEKFEAAESTWGRGPSDPFTGVPFSHSVFPIPDTSLKSRIDQFLLENGHLAQFSGVGRTTGREKHDVNHFSRSLRKFEQVNGIKLTSGNILPLGSHKCSVSLHSPLSSAEIPVHDECHVMPAPHSGPLHGNTRSEVEQFESSHTNSCRGSKRKNNEDGNPPPDVLLKSSKSSYMKNHEDAVEDSLHCALQSVLTGLPSFVQTTADPHSEIIDKNANCECSQCHSVEYLFKLPCEHLLCRPCLVIKTTDSMGKMECEVCHNEYYSSNVIRFHK